VGANGSGKSTLLTLLAGLARPDRGEVRLRRGRAAMVFQSPERQLFGETVAEDIAFGPRNLGVAEKEIAGRVARAAALVELDPPLLGRSPFHLSGGQQRRAALAGVLAMEPAVLVLDEPADGLDPAGAARLLAMLRDIARETGAAVLAASHAVPEQVGAFDRILVLAEGRIAAAGSPATVLASGALPDAFLPPHLRAQKALAAMGYRPGRTALSVEEAVESMVGAIRA
jgi:energy-coupling factor transport system ATP-binding protein